ncbi:MAG: hypothetical protein MUF51_08030 [Vicinamibacteria bacterium]|jgi:hypothetical protein|nr:hypothetical protein [Vicinamibacteria bacterium]
MKDAPDHLAIEDERQRLRLLRVMVDLTANTLAQGRLSWMEAQTLVSACRQQALTLFPDQAATFDLILVPRFTRLMREFCTPPANWHAA